MLARIAEAVYWTARDIERASAIARALEISHATSLEGALQNGAGRGNVWEPVIGMVGDPVAFAATHRRTDERSVTWYLTLDESNPDSVMACLARARTRVRAIRSRLPTEVFEAIGSGEITTRTWTARRLSREGVYAFCHQIRGHVAAVDGAADRGMRRDEHWQFLRLGRHLERAVQTARLLSVFADLQTDPPQTAQGIGHWHTLLRLASSYEAYLRVAPTGRGAESAATFLLLDPMLPSSVGYCLTEIAESFAELRALHVAPADAVPKAAVYAATRAAAAAAQPASPRRRFDRLETRLTEIHGAVASIFLPEAEFADGPLYTQAVRQAQN